MQPAPQDHSPPDRAAGPSVLAEREARLSLRQRGTVLMLVAGAVWMLVLVAVSVAGWKKAARDTQRSGWEKGGALIGSTAFAVRPFSVGPYDDPHSSEMTHNYESRSEGQVPARVIKNANGRLVAIVPARVPSVVRGGFIWIGQAIPEYPYIDVQACSMFLDKAESYRLIRSSLDAHEKEEMHRLLDTHAKDLVPSVDAVNVQSTRAVSRLEMPIGLRIDMILGLTWGHLAGTGHFRQRCEYEVFLREVQPERAILVDGDMMNLALHATEVPYFVDQADARSMAPGHVDYNLRLRHTGQFTSRLLLMRMYYPTLVMLWLVFLVLMPLIWSSHVRRRIRYYRAETLEATFRDQDIAQAFYLFVRRHWLLSVMIFWLPPVAAVVAVWILHGPGALPWYPNRIPRSPDVLYHPDMAAMLGYLAAAPLLGLYSTYRSMWGRERFRAGVLLRALWLTSLLLLVNLVVYVLIQVVQPTSAPPESFLCHEPFSFLVASVLVCIPLGVLAWRRMLRAVDAMWQGLKPSNRR